MRSAFRSLLLDLEISADKQATNCFYTTEPSKHSVRRISQKVRDYLPQDGNKGPKPTWRSPAPPDRLLQTAQGLYLQACVEPQKCIHMLANCDQQPPKGLASIAQHSFSGSRGHSFTSSDFQITMAKSDNTKVSQNRISTNVDHIDVILLLVFLDRLGQILHV